MAKGKQYQIAFSLNAKLASNFAKSFQAANSQVSGLVKTVKTAVGAFASIEGAKNIIGTYAEFEQSMANVSAITGQTGEGLKELEKLARDMGAKTTKSASEAADAIQYMGLAGWDASQIMKGLEPVLRLSEAGGLDLARTSDLVTDSMSALGLTVEELPKYLDMAAQTSRKANTDVGALLEAMIGVGGSFKNLKVPMSEANTLLGVLANRGKKGSEAGNALNSILVNLTSGAGQAGKAMGELGVNAFDSQGNFKGVSSVLLELNHKLKDMTEEQKNTYLSMIGGKTQLDTLQALLSGVTEEYGDLEKSITNSDGALMDMATTMNNTLSGSWAMFLSAMDELKIKVAEKLGPTLKKLVDTAAVKIPEAFDMASTSIEFIKSVLSGDWSSGAWTDMIGVFSNLGLDNIQIVGAMEGFRNIILGVKDTLINLKDIAVSFGTFVINNWGLIKPIVVGIGLAFTAWKIGKVTHDGVKSTMSLYKSLKKTSKATLDATRAQYGNIKAKIIDKSETLYLKALYAGDFLKALGKNTKAIAKNSLAWVKNTALMLLQKAQMIGLKAIQLISAGVTWVMTAAQWALNAAFLASPVGWVVLGIAALIAIGIVLYKNWDTIKLKAVELWESFKTNFGGLAAFFEGVWATVVSTFSGAFEGIKGIIDGVLQAFGGIIQFFQGVFTGNWQMVWDGLKNIVAGTFQSLVGLVTTPLNAIISLVNGAISAINKVSITIPDWVPGLGGRTYGVNIPQIPMFAKGTTGFNTPDTFVAGEKGAELVTNAKGYKVFTANQTQKIFNQSQISTRGNSLSSIPNLNERVSGIKSQNTSEKIQLNISVNVDNYDVNKDVEEKAYLAAFRGAEAALKKLEEKRERNRRVSYVPA